MHPAIMGRKPPTTIVEVTKKIGRGSTARKDP